jgi:hypothetical protein
MAEVNFTLNAHRSPLFTSRGRASEHDVRCVLTVSVISHMGKRYHMSAGGR